MRCSASSLLTFMLWRSPSCFHWRSSSIHTRTCRCILDVIEVSYHHGRTNPGPLYHDIVRGSLQRATKPLTGTRRNGACVPEEHSNRLSYPRTPMRGADVRPSVPLILDSPSVSCRTARSRLTGACSMVMCTQTYEEALVFLVRRLVQAVIQGRVYRSRFHLPARCVAQHLYIV